jgi:CubicO group peptidase (beta-lactamase class C family)
VVTEKGSAQLPTPPGTFSWGGIYSTNYWADPKEKIVGLFFKQLWNDPAGESSTKFQVMTYAALAD